MALNESMKDFPNSYVNLKYFQLLKPMKLFLYCDASFGDVNEGGIQGGQLILLAG